MLQNNSVNKKIVKNKCSKNKNEDCYLQFKCAKPLDYSYKKLESLEELNGNDKPLPMRVNGAPKKDKNNKRYMTGSFWLNNNNLKNLNGLKNLGDRILVMSDYLSWLDLSGNNLTTISDELLLFPNLSMLYLHRNNIEDFKEVSKLQKLLKLRTLTLNNNPMSTCMVPNFRISVIQLLPHLRKLDNVVVVKSEREVKTQNTHRSAQINSS